MNIRALLATGVAALVLCAAPLVDRGAIGQEQNVVTVYNWSDYIDEQILVDFENETGIRVVYDVFDSNEVLEAKLLAGGTGYDVVVPTATFMKRQIDAGVYQQLDKSLLSNIDNYWDVVAERVATYDPDNSYSVNYMWGTTGLGVNSGKVIEILGDDQPRNSLALLFDPEIASQLSECGIHVLNAPEEVIPAALAYAGWPDPDDRSPEALAKAEEVIMAVRPYIQSFNSSAYIDALANGDICLALGWSGDILQARDRAAEADNGVNVEYHIPSEGALMWFDQMVIPADAPRPENAHIFIDYMLRPDVMAKASNYVYYANGNLPSQALLNDDVIGDTAIYPDDETLDNLYTVTTPEGPEVRRLSRLWTRVKTGQ